MAKQTNIRRRGKAWVVSARVNGTQQWKSCRTRDEAELELARMIAQRARGETFVALPPKRDTRSRSGRDIRVECGCRTLPPPVPGRAVTVDVKRAAVIFARARVQQTQSARPPQTGRQASRLSPSLRSGASLNEAGSESLRKPPFKPYADAAVEATRN
jgi:hypothetical protein